jgi:glucose/arabinose dehydrogenase
MGLAARERPPADAALALTLLLSLAACHDAGTGASPVIPCDPDNGGLSLPPGFCAVVVARAVGTARHLAVRPNGDVYVAVDNSATATGAVLALRDTDGDGHADVQERFGPTGGNGIAWQGTSLYFAPNDRVLRYEFSGNALLPTSGPVTVVAGLPADGEHVRKTVVPDQSGGLFVNIGSATDACQVVNRIPLSPGVFPCSELGIRAGVWRFNANGTGQSQADGVRFASELRNMNALALDPADGVLYGVQNGRDFLSLYWPGLFTLQDHVVLPAEELLRIDQGKLYGWPYCFFDALKNVKLLNPEYGGDGSLVGMCQDRERPVVAFPAHWAPLGMLFYTGSQFPAEYAGGLFVAFHGSQPAPPAPGGGFVVTFLPWRNGGPSGTYRVFADGFAAGTFTVAGAAHRAVGLAQGPDGSLYVSDDQAGWIWRVSYVGMGN